MPSLIAYRKASDDYTTFHLALPDAGAGGEPSGQEIATLADGRTVVALRDGVSLPPEQPPLIASSIETLPQPLPEELRAQIREASPHAQLIDRRVVERIRAVYSVDDEIKMLRIAPSPETAAWNEHVEACRAWGRAERAKIGL